jgi:hypothetical protein
MFRCNHHRKRAQYSSLRLIILTTVTLVSSNNALPEDGDYTKTYRSCFKVNFNANFKIVFKIIHLCISC